MGPDETGRAPSGTHIIAEAPKRARPLPVLPSPSTSLAEAYRRITQLQQRMRETGFAAASSGLDDLKIRIWYHALSARAYEKALEARRALPSAS